ncbi:cupin domain-containing protein [Halomonas elongata]|uniref:Cupin domain-containing protein n=1 Tax=Halomonas elongata (strain ATCC 33173 / DSM 2581 / NBRC 15536 / NCIMB 2198 / 1H9) TaxID=768066 RepID=A0ABZ0TDF9_HALED|nr:cupin domain-containing protein [Halomonas elongata]WPU47609.1 cupin domain-containing protein [Halomonas elongata DSM 2581]
MKIALVLAVVLPFSSLVLAEDVEPEGGIVSAATHELNWVELPESGGIKYANVRGDIVGEGPYEAFVLFPAGKDNPFHYHSEAIPTVVIQGTFYAEIDGERTEYPAGSFYDVPGKKDHYSGCLPGMDCLLFQYQEDRFDLVPQPEE